MRNCRAGLVVLGLLLSSAATAQRVQVLRFDITQDTAETPVPIYSGEPSSPLTSLASETLVNDFAALAPAPVGPLGMYSATGAAITNSCRSFPYRPRRDIGWRAETRRARLFPTLVQVACDEGVPVGLFDALIAQESRYDATALSLKGAIGLAQLMPTTALSLGVVTPWDAISNLRGGARYLRAHLLEFGRVDLALAAYNAGPGRVRKLRRVPDFTETRAYVSAITKAWAESSMRGTSIMTVPNEPQPLPASHPVPHIERGAVTLVFGQPSRDTTS